MIDAGSTSAVPQYLAVIGSLGGVAVGSGLTWLLQRNEWGRQRRWELTRDATLDAIRALADLEEAVTKLDSAFTQIEGTLTDEVRSGQTNMRIDAILKFGQHSSAYKRAHIIADLAVGGDLSRSLSNYFQFALPLALEGCKNRRTFLQGANKKRELALRGNAVIISAREALGIQDAGDLPLLDESN